LFDFYNFLNVVYAYPFVMSILWIALGLRFFINYVRFDNKQDRKANLTKTPLVSILIPCYNEEEVIEDTVKHLQEDLVYPNYEILCIDDGSSDKTWEILQELQRSGKYPLLRIIKVENNAGKAHALTQGAIAAKGQYLLGVDADSFLERDAVDHLMANILGMKNTIDYFLGRTRRGIGAVTGNPIVRNRSTLLSKIQLVEYASIIGLIKRAQRLYGRIGTISGVCVLFRKRALLDVGWWDQDMITEDIAITWKLQLGNWEAHFEPEALCWMLVPESITGLYKQRLRWAQGGSEVLLRHLDIFAKPKDWVQLPLLIELLISLIWSFLWYIAMFVFFYQWYVFGYPNWVSIALGGLLVIVCMVQLIISLEFTNRYDPLAIRNLFWAGWYPFVYWLINPLTVIVAFPKAVKRKIKGGQATWTSPDRGMSE
jgi:biofilm PGA synthesis N-glycosyltransferase PgaC